MNKKELLEQCKNLGIEAAEELTNKELKALIDKKEAESPLVPKDGVEELEVEAEEVNASESYTDDRGIEWQFKPDAPKTINIDGRPMTQAEILQTEDVISELVYGNSNFITRKN